MILMVQSNLIDLWIMRNRDYQSSDEENFPAQFASESKMFFQNREKSQREVMINVKQFQQIRSNLMEMRSSQMALMIAKLLDHQGMMKT
jgi:hypothetical protein